jgi:hypothetical protein
VRNRAAFRLSLERRQATYDDNRPNAAAPTASGRPIFLVLGFASVIPHSRTHPYPSEVSLELIKIDIDLVALVLGLERHPSSPSFSPRSEPALAHYSRNSPVARSDRDFWQPSSVLLHHTALRDHATVRLSVVVLSVGVDYWATWKKPAAHQ